MNVRGPPPCYDDYRVQVDLGAHIRAGRTFHRHIFHPPSSVLLWLSFLSMAPFDVTRVSAAVWRWFCRCPEIIGPVYDTSSDEEFFTPPTSPQPCSIEIRGPASTVSPTHGSLNLLSPSQTHRLRRRHAEAVRQLTSPPPVVTPVPHGPLKAYQRPIKVYRPSWAP